ncbi:MAG: Ku protein [Myxococcota bacterium]
MAPRAIASGTISFGLVSIPVKVFTATSPAKVRFNMIEPETGARPKQQYVSSVSGEVLERSAMAKGYEHARGQFVILDPEELKALEADRSNGLEIAEFVPLDAVDLIQVEKSYYIAPDKGGDKAYHLLSEAMRRKDVVAVARWAAKGKEQLVLLRPYRAGLVIHQLFYANEVRAFDDLDVGGRPAFSDGELDLADRLIEQLAHDTFEPEKYSDTYTERVRALIDQKIAGEEITIAPDQPKAQIIDLFEALKQSLEATPAAASESPGEQRGAEGGKRGRKKATAATAAKGIRKAVPRKKTAKKKKTSASG